MCERFAGLARNADAARSSDFGSWHLLGTSGTVTTLAAIALDLPRYNRARVDMSWYKTAAMLAIVERLADLGPEALAGIGGIGPERAALMLPGCALFSAICATRGRAPSCGASPTAACARACCAN